MNFIHRTMGSPPVQQIAGCVSLLIQQLDSRFFPAHRHGVLFLFFSTLSISPGIAWISNANI